jgi:Raf kinase inhibitor-like YbhB/YbcL family protein
MKKLMHPSALLAVGAMAFGVLLSAQAPGGGGGQGKGPGGPGGPGGGGRGGPRGPALSVTSNAFPDGGVIPMHNAGVGDNKSPDFTFQWMMGTMPATAPAELKSYAVILHDVENAGRGKTTEDTLHWSAFNIPGDAKGLPEGLGMGTLADGTVNGPGIRGGAMGVYFGPGAGPGPFHHYVFEFYALDTKLDLPATATRADLMKALDGHVIGKAAYVGRFHNQPAQ